MADYSSTAARISILSSGDCWAQRQLHAGIRYVSVGSKLRKSLSSMEGVSMLTLAEFYSMADSSPTAGHIPILFFRRLLGSSLATQRYKVRPYRMKTQEVTLFCKGSLR